MRKNLFPLYLFLPLFIVICPAHTAVQDNYVWLRESILGKIVLPVDSVVDSGCICIRELRETQAMTLVLECIRERIITTSGLNLCLLNEPMNSCGYVLEYELTQFRFWLESKKHKWYMPKKDFTRNAVYSINVRLYQTGSGRLLWSRGFEGSEIDTLGLEKLSYTKSPMLQETFSGLNNGGISTWVDLSILMASASVLLYFLFK